MHLDTLHEAEMTCSSIYYVKLYRMQAAQAFKYQDYDALANQFLPSDEVVQKMGATGMESQDTKELVICMVEEQAISLINNISERDIVRSGGRRQDDND